MSFRPVTPMISFSIASATGSSQEVFPAADQGSFSQRTVTNPNATGSIWVNPVGGTAAANGLDCIELVPGAVMNFESTNALTAITTAANKINAFQR